MSNFLLTFATVFLTLFRFGLSPGALPLPPKSLLNPLETVSPKVRDFKVPLLILVSVIPLPTACDSPDCPVNCFVNPPPVYVLPRTLEATLLIKLPAVLIAFLTPGLRITLRTPGMLGLGLLFVGVPPPAGFGRPCLFLIKFLFFSNPAAILCFKGTGVLGLGGPGLFILLAILPPTFLAADIPLFMIPAALPTKPSLV